MQIVLEPIAIPSLTWFTPNVMTRCSALCFSASWWAQTTKTLRVTLTAVWCIHDASCLAWAPGLSLSLSLAPGKSRIFPHFFLLMPLSRHTWIQLMRKSPSSSWLHVLLLWFCLKHHGCEALLLSGGCKWMLHLSIQAVTAVILQFDFLPKCYEINSGC